MSAFMISLTEYAKLRDVFVVTEQISHFRVLPPLVDIAKTVYSKYKVTEKTIKSLVYLNAKATGSCPRSALHEYKMHKLNKMNLSHEDMILETNLVLIIHQFLTCILYQCTENPVIYHTERNAFYDAVKEFKKDLAEAYTYNKACKLNTWDEMRF